VRQNDFNFIVSSNNFFHLQNYTDFLPMDRGVICLLQLPWLCACLYS